MTLLSTHSPVSSGGRRGQRAAVIALCAGALALVAGCSAAAAPLTPRMAISLAADKTQSVSSMAAAVSTQSSGTVAETTTSAVRMQLKPTLLAEVETVQGETVHTTMNVTDVNRPVHLALPSASQAVILTRSDLGGM